LKDDILACVENLRLVIYLYNILGFVQWWSSFLSIRPVICPSKFLIPEKEDDGTGGGQRLMATAAVYPNILTIRNFSKTLKNRNKMKTYKINIFKHETRKGNTVK
jgi:hypothetical protein